MSVPALGTVWPALVVGFTVFFLVIVLQIDLLSSVPANVYGYAATVAYSLTKPSMAAVTPGEAGTGPLQNLLAASFANPLILLIVSLAIGAGFGYVSGQIATRLTKQPA